MLLAVTDYGNGDGAAIRKVALARVVGPKVNPVKLPIGNSVVTGPTMTQPVSVPLVSCPDSLTVATALDPLMLSWPPTRRIFGVSTAEMGSLTLKRVIFPLTRPVTPKAFTEPVAVAETSNVGVMIASTCNGVPTMAWPLAVVDTVTLPEAFNVKPAIENDFVPEGQVF